MHNSTEAIDLNAHIQTMTRWIVWGSILLCAFINLALIAHVASYYVGLIVLQSLIGFLILTAQFHLACIVLSTVALGLALAFSCFDQRQPA